MARIKYNISPLIEVIFQLRFPTILSINKDEPALFQEKVRTKYPLYTVKNEVIPQIGVNGVTQVVVTNKNHEFVSKNKKTKINLTSSFLAISTHEYDVWESFQSVINEVVNSFEETYHPSFYVRVGLRYIDAITKSRWGLEGCLWKDLIKEDVLGILKDNEHMSSFLVNAEYKCSDDISTLNHFELVHIDGKEELSLLIDCDYYQNEIIEIEGWRDLANNLHVASSNFIANTITERLSQAMEPVELNG